MLHIKKKWHQSLEGFFLTCACSTATPQIERLLQESEGFFSQRSGRLLPKSGGFVHTQVSKMRSSFAYGISGAALYQFRSFVYNSTV